MKFIAHRSDDKREQTVKEHLEGTAELAENFAVPTFKALARHIGIMHDIGKYSLAFQRRINGEDNSAVEHAICGAKELQALVRTSMFARLEQYCIAGHHSGLPDGGSDTDLADAASLCGRLKRVVPDYSAYAGEVDTALPDCGSAMSLFARFKTKADVKEATELYTFLTKYLFSCLTDADFIDTERFCNSVERGLYGDFSKALELVDRKLDGFVNDTEVKKARACLQAQAFAKVDDMGEINILNMPTGSGKTLCSIRLALEAAVKQGKKRIIYVIPYTSIIEQTADEFEKIFGDVLPVLQHHSNYAFDKGGTEDTTAEKLKRACENWDAGLIVTTSVQFFQSLYHYKGSRLRKLHNLADTVIVFDEVHMLPTEYLQPCLRAVGYITHLLGSRAIFLSATMPDYTTLFSRFLPNNSVCGLISDRSSFAAFRKCSYVNLGKVSLEAVAELAGRSGSALVVVNSRRTARELYSMLGGCKYHLSTYMTPEHRSAVIAEIRAALKAEKPITVVSTSLIECGVDLDFQTVFRQLAGLDSVLQSGGRCNRDGKRADGTVYIFETDEQLRGELGIRANITRAVLSEYEDITSPECVEDYFRRLFNFSDDRIMSNCITDKMGNVSFYSIPFREYAMSFEFIKSETIGIVVNRCRQCADLLERLKYGDKSAMRGLQRYTVPVYSYEYEEMLKTGIISELGGVFVLESAACYSDEIGLNISGCCDEDYIS